MATAAELAGAKPPEKTDGMSFLPSLKGTAQDEPRYLGYGVRYRQWKADYSAGSIRGVIDLEANPREERAAAGTLPTDVEAKMLVFAQRHFSPAYQAKFQRKNAPQYPE